MKNYETLWEGLFILEVEFLCVSLLPSFDLSLITAGQAVMTVDIASIQPKHGQVMGINQIEHSHLLSHASLFSLSVSSLLCLFHVFGKTGEGWKVPCPSGTVPHFC